jgi:hypothetical protein
MNLKKSIAQNNTPQKYDLGFTANWFCCKDNTSAVYYYTSYLCVLFFSVMKLIKFPVKVYTILQQSQIFCTEPLISTYFC